MAIESSAKDAMTRDASDDINEFGHHIASWLDDSDGVDDDLDASGGKDNGEQELRTDDDNAVIPWLQSDDAHDDSDSDIKSSSDARGGVSASLTQPQQQQFTSSSATPHATSSRVQSEADEDDETVADFSDDWADEYLAMDARASSKSREPEKSGLSKLFGRTESRSSSLRDEIHLVEQATERAASAAMATVDADSSRSTSVPPLLSVRPMNSRSFTSASSTLYQRAAETSASAGEIRVHPITPAPLAAAADKELEHQKTAPLSPNSLKRANSVYVSPTSTSKALMKRQDSLTTSVSRSQMLWNSDASRRGSRLLDEWKRKEIWTDFKRAEENIAAPQIKRVSTQHDEQRAAVSTSRLESLLQNLRAEISSSTCIGGKVSPAVATTSEALAVASQHNSATQSLGALGVSGSASSELPPNHERRPTMFAQLTAPYADATAAVCSLAEYEQLVQDKRFLADELENRTRASATDKEIIRNMNDRVLALESAERENAFLKDEIERHVVQELGARERLKTLAEQLARTAKSEEQLKLQTQQLFEQNQALQSDLLEKIAAEAAKVQKMAHLSAEKETLMHELERKDAVVSKRERQDREQLQQQTVRRLLRLKRLAHLRAAMAKLHHHSTRLTAARTHALGVLTNAHRLAATKVLAAAFHELKMHDARARHRAGLSGLQLALDNANQSARDLAARSSALQLARIVENWRARRLRDGFQVFQYHSQNHHALETSIELGCAKLHALVLGRSRAHKQRAFASWRARTELETMQHSYEQVRRSERELLEAKDCVFALSREKTKLEEKLQRARDDSQRQVDQLSESAAELQVVKHGYVATVVRDVERAWLRLVFTEWRLQTHVSVASKDLQLQTEMAELKAAERDKHAKTVDDYNCVLRNDLERFQFFSQDKRIAVDVLTKKLLREEDRYRQLEERHVGLDEKLHTLRSQLAALLEWDGLELPPPVLALAKDLAAGSLNELFLLHATAMPDPSNNAQSAVLTLAGATGGASDPAAPRLSMDALLRMIEYSSLLEANQLRTEALAERIAGHFPNDAADRGILFPDFVTGVHSVLQSVFRDSAGRAEHMKAFWRSLLALVDPARWNASGGGGAANAGGAAAREHLIAGRSPWAGHLSDDILQNQEKLLAVLEHETAVVERAVMEKASLKHTYPTSDHASSVASTFYEYQCDPMLPPEPANGALAVATSGPHPVASVPGFAVPAEVYANWYQTAQIRDLFLAFHQPLLKVLRKYTNETRLSSHGNQFCLQLAGVLRMLEDLKLYPMYLPHDAVLSVFNGLCDRDGIMTPQAFTLFLGACALELYTKSQAAKAPPAFQLSPREILLSFFCDLGFLAESEAPAPARICFVGAEIESILWSLFEYYATSDAASARAEDERVAMTAAKFAKFMTEIAGAGAGADDVYERVHRESRRGASAQWSMYFDEFYSAISYVQEARNQHVVYPNPGEAVRHWMQQTQ